jgi:hypothetical protein
VTDQEPGFEARNRLRTIVNRTTELTPLKSVATRAIASRRKSIPRRWTWRP